MNLLHEFLLYSVHVQDDAYRVAFAGSGAVFRFSYIQIFPIFSDFPSYSSFFSVVGFVRSAADKPASF